MAGLPGELHCTTDWNREKAPATAVGRGRTSSRFWSACQGRISSRFWSACRTWRIATARFVALLLQGWPRSWPRSGRKSSDLLRETALHSKDSASSSGTATRTGRGGMCPRRGWHLPACERRMCLAGHCSTTTESRDGDRGERADRLEARHLASKATVPGDAYCPRHRSLVVLLAREKPHAKDRVMMCRLD